MFLFYIYIYIYPDALIEAIERRQTELVKDLIAAGADVNKFEENVFYSDPATPLLKAASSRDVEIVKLLIKAGADVDKVDRIGDTPLHKATSSRDVEIVKLLLDAGANVCKTDKYGYTALMDATNSDYKEIVTAIENFKTTHTMITAIQEDEARTLSINRENSQEKTEASYTVLMAACASNNMMLVEKLIDCGADIFAQDMYGRTAPADMCSKTKCSKTNDIDFIGNNRSKESIFSQGKTKESTRNNVSDSKSHHSYLKR